MPKGEVSWWHACRLSGEGVTQKWFVLLEFFSSNATAYAVARIAASDGSSAWENTFSADELAVLSKSGSQQPKVLESIQKACETKLSDVCQIRRQSGQTPTLTFSLHGGRTVDLNLQSDILCSVFADRTALYDSHLNANISGQEQAASELTKKRSLIEKKIQVAVKKSLESNENLVLGVRVLLEQKRKHFERETPI